MSSPLGAFGSSPLEAFKGSPLGARAALGKILEGLATHEWTIHAHYDLRTASTTSQGGSVFNPVFPSLVWQDEGLAHLLQVWGGQHGTGQLGPLRWYAIDGDGGMPTTSSTRDSDDYDILGEDSTGFAPSGNAIGISPVVEDTDFVTWRHATSINLLQFAESGVAKSVHGIMLAPAEVVFGGTQRIGILFLPVPFDIPDLDDFVSPDELTGLGIGRNIPLADFNGWYTSNYAQVPEPDIDLIDFVETT